MHYSVKMCALQLMSGHGGVPLFTVPESAGDVLVRMLSIVQVWNNMRIQAEAFQASQVEEALISFLYKRSGVLHPSEVLGDVNTEEFDAAEPLYCRSIYGEWCV